MVQPSARTPRTAGLELDDVSDEDGLEAARSDQLYKSGQGLDRSGVTGVQADDGSGA